MGRRILMYFTVFGIAMWFFGNLYEAIVIGPNIAGDSKEQLKAFQQFTEVTNPVYYYVPLTLVAAITLIVWFVRTPFRAPEKVSLLLACVAEIAAVILSVYVIVKLNMTLFFGSLGETPRELHDLALQWNVLNLVRVVLTAVALLFALRALRLVWQSSVRHPTAAV
ncbi:MAG: anthrone oxygenase family protein [Mycobacterium sp.]